jgi:hypothetical protein
MSRSFLKPPRFPDGTSVFEHKKSRITRCSWSYCALHLASYASTFRISFKFSDGLSRQRRMAISGGLGGLSGRHSRNWSAADILKRPLKVPYVTARGWPGQDRLRDARGSKANDSSQSSPGPPGVVLKLASTSPPGNPPDAPAPPACSHRAAAVCRDNPGSSLR